MTTNTQTTDVAAPEQEAEREVAVTDLTLQTMMRADLDVQISTAKAYPRSLKAFREEALSTVSLSQEIAESCTYGLPRGKDASGKEKIIEGPSIRFAEIIFAAYGNIRVGGRTVMNDGRWVTSQGVCHDLQKNTSKTIEVKRSIMQNEYKWDDMKRRSVRTGRMVPMNDDLQTLHSNACTSIATRNAILTVIPKAYWADIWEVAKQVALGTQETLVDRRDKALKYFADKGVSVERVCQTLGVPGVEDIDLEKLGQLTKFKTALKNQEATLDAIFPPVTPPPTAKGAAATKGAESKLKGKTADKGTDEGAAATT